MNIKQTRICSIWFHHKRPKVLKQVQCGAGISKKGRAKVQGIPKQKFVKFHPGGNINLRRTFLEQQPKIHHNCLPRAAAEINLDIYEIFVAEIWQATLEQQPICTAGVNSMNVCAVFAHQGKTPAKREGFEKNSKIIVQTSAQLTPGAGPTTSSWRPWTQCFAVVTSGAPRPVRGTHQFVIIYILKAFPVSNLRFYLQ